VSCSSRNCFAKMCAVYIDGIEHCQVVNADRLPMLNDVGSCFCASRYRLVLGWANAVVVDEVWNH